MKSNSDLCASSTRDVVIGHTIAGDVGSRDRDWSGVQESFFVYVSYVH